tara:strand:- start:2992 stop:4329 length:1338 start_codon:yes stop_codon:yes gene_type:complete
MPASQITAIKPVVAIIGRPNVGKSTLFNRITGRRNAIVSDTPGTTRDRVILESQWSKYPFILVDTGGMDLFPDDEVWTQVEIQIQYAIQECDIIVFLVDVSDGITETDREVSDVLRKSGKPIILAGNKVDNEERTTFLSELYELGMGDPVGISAYHNIGIDDLMATIIKKFPDDQAAPEVDSDLRLAIVGRTNVGKSMLINAITGENRAIVSSISGTTRDSLDSSIIYKDQKVQLIDTAGIRRRGKIDRGIEKYSVLRSMKAIDRCETAALIIDASESSTGQDTHIASYILNAGKAIVIVVNKWDLTKEIGLSKNEMELEIRKKYKFAPYAPICFTSALKGEGINPLLDTAMAAKKEWIKEVPRAEIRKTILTAVSEHIPPTNGRKELKIYSALQDGIMPPSFTFFVNHSDMVHFSYKRYLENKIRDSYKFTGSPIKMRFQGWKR